VRKRRRGGREGRREREEKEKGGCVGRLILEETGAGSNCFA
jgi:hypothetical protein